VYVLREYERYFNTGRPHQGIGQAIPDPPLTSSVSGKIQRRDILGGIIHDYFHAGCLTIHHLDRIYYDYTGF
jgi:putative transposase